MEVLDAPRLREHPGGVPSSLDSPCGCMEKSLTNRFEQECFAAYCRDELVETARCRCRHGNISSFTHTTYTICTILWLVPSDTFASIFFEFLTGVKTVRKERARHDPSRSHTCPRRAELTMLTAQVSFSGIPEPS